MIISFSFFVHFYNQVSLLHISSNVLLLLSFVGFIFQTCAQHYLLEKFFVNMLLLIDS